MTKHNSIFWMMQPAALQAYRALSNNVSLKNLSKQQLNDYLDAVILSRQKSIKKINGTAEIRIEGVLGNYNDFYDFLYWGYLDSYPSIIEALNLAENDEEIEVIKLIMNTPGGRSDGIFSLTQRIREVKKPIAAVVNTQSFSAGYLIASQTDRIISLNSKNEVGSIGVGVSMYVSNNIIDIVNTDSPKKWPDATTEQGKKIIQNDLDRVFSTVVQEIAAGRAAASGKKVTEKDVIEKFGKGGVFFAEDALEVNMIDEIVPEKSFISNSQFFKENEKGVGNMSINNVSSLLQQYPELVKELQSTAENKEKERVSALLIAGENTGNMEYALKCVQEGKSFTDPVVSATFLTAGKNRDDLDKRKKDSDMLSQLDAGSSSVDTEQEEQAKQAEAFLKKEGYYE